MNLVGYHTEMVGDRVILRVLDDHDATIEYANWLNDPEVNKYLETRETTIAELKKYIQEKLQSPACLFFGIFSKMENTHIGNVKLEPIDFERKIGTVGILIGNKEYWGRGIATESIELLSRFAFDTLHLEKLTLGVIRENVAAIRAYEKCGFTTVSIEANAINHNGVLHDQIHMEKILS